MQCQKPDIWRKRGRRIVGCLIVKKKKIKQNNLTRLNLIGLNPGIQEVATTPLISGLIRKLSGYKPVSIVGRFCLLTKTMEVVYLSATKSKTVTSASKRTMS